MRVNSLPSLKSKFSRIVNFFFYLSSYKKLISPSKLWPKWHVACTWFGQGFVHMQCFNSWYFKKWVCSLEHVVSRDTNNFPDLFQIGPLFLPMKHFFLTSHKLPSTTTVRCVSHWEAAVSGNEGGPNPDLSCESQAHSSNLYVISSHIHAFIFTSPSVSRGLWLWRPWLT